MADFRCLSWKRGISPEGLQSDSTTTQANKIASASNAVAMEAPRTEIVDSANHQWANRPPTNPAAVATITKGITKQSRANNAAKIPVQFTRK